MFEDSTYKAEPTQSSASDDDAISFLPPIPSPSPLIPTTEEPKSQAQGASAITSSLPTAPTTLTPPATNGNPAEHALQLSKAKEEEERRRWCAAYDAAQPTGRSLSAKEAEFQEILRIFRESQPKKVRTEVVVTVEQPKKKGFKKLFGKVV